MADSKDWKAFNALSTARAWLRTAELALAAYADAYARSAKLHIVNARADIDEALTDLRGEGKVD